MTVRINLMPQMRAPIRRTRSASSVWLAVMALTVAGTGIYHYQAARTQLTALEKEIQFTRADIAAGQARLSVAAELGQFESKIEKQEQAVGDLGGREWSGFLLDVRDLVPHGVVLTRWEGGHDRLAIAGHAARLADLAHFVLGLARSPSSLGIEIHSVNRVAENQREFSLTVVLSGAEGGAVR